MNVGAIIAAVPWLRRAWRVMPTPLRVPVLVVAGAVGAWYVVSGRHRILAEEARPGDDDRPPLEEPPA